MAWYYGTYSCGHDGRVNIIGPGKDREWKKEREFSGLCPECCRKKIEEERAAKSKEIAAKNEETKKEAEEMELPELSGSPKQVAWANTIRVEFIKKFSEKITQTISKGKKFVRIVESGEYVTFKLSDLQEIEKILMSKAEARFWIDHRNYTLLMYVKEAYNELQEIKSIPEEVKKEMEEEEATLTVEPEKRKKEGIASISVENNSIMARYIKDDEFREIVKSLGYSWEGVWCKKINECSGPEADRVAELGNKLLANGFTVRFPNKEALNMAVSGKFSPECDNWVKYNTEKEMLAVSWKGHNDKLYQEAKKLSGSKWYRGSMLVPVEFYNEVLDFADTMGFQISKRAKSEIESFKEEEAKFIKEDVKEAVFEEKDGKEELRKQLEKAGVIEDLRDEA